MCVFVCGIGYAAYMNDGVDLAKVRRRKGFDGTIVPIKNARNAVHTGLTSCCGVMCVCVYYVCMCESVCLSCRHEWRCESCERTMIYDSKNE